MAYTYPSFSGFPGKHARKFAEIRNRLVLSGFSSPWDEGFRSPFRNPNWHVVLVGANLGIDHGNTRVLFDDDPSWPDRGDLPPMQTYDDPLFWCLEKRKSNHMIVTRDRVEGDFDWAVKHNAVIYCACAPDMESIDAANIFMEGNVYNVSDNRWLNGDGTIASFGGAEVIAFDESEEWATYDLGYELPHLLGGTPTFIRQYIDAAGGEDHVRAVFYHWDVKGWMTLDWDNAPCLHQRNLYALAGWPPPNYASIERDWKVDRPIDWSPMFGNRIKSIGPSN